MTLGQRIQDLRKQAGLSQEALGETLGVSRQAVSKWEGDNGIPELDTLIAMSRLFGVTVGQLLGVEEPVPAEEESTAAMDEERVEAILSRYVEESRQHEPTRRPTLASWVIAAVVIVAAFGIAAVSIGRTREVREDINDLWSNVSEIESLVTNVRNQVGGLSDELKTILEEQGRLQSSFDCQVIGFDVERQTVNVRLSLTLKEYTDGSLAQFKLNWIKADQTTGELTSEQVAGPEFVTTVTLPMNHHLEIGVQVAKPDGTILEQQLDTVYSGMNPNQFSLQERSAGSVTGEKSGIYSYDLTFESEWPELIYPVSAVTVIRLNGEEAYRQQEQITADHGVYTLAGSAQMRRHEAAELDAVCYVTDNYGREYEMRLPSAGGVSSVVPADKQR